jgi:hypothetical protein
MTCWKRLCYCCCLHKNCSDVVESSSSSYAESFSCATDSSKNVSSSSIYQYCVNKWYPPPLQKPSWKSKTESWIIQHATLNYYIDHIVKNYINWRTIMIKRDLHYPYSLYAIETIIVSILFYLLFYTPLKN